MSKTKRMVLQQVKYIILLYNILEYRHNRINKNDDLNGRVSLFISTKMHAMINNDDEEFHQSIHFANKKVDDFTFILDNLIKHRNVKDLNFLVVDTICQEKGVPKYVVYNLTREGNPIYFEKSKERLIFSILNAFFQERRKYKFIYDENPTIRRPLTETLARGDKVENSQKFQNISKFAMMKMETVDW